MHIFIVLEVLRKPGGVNREDEKPIVQGLSGHSLKTMIEQLMLETLDYLTYTHE